MGVCVVVGSIPARSWLPSWTELSGAAGIEACGMILFFRCRLPSLKPFFRSYASQSGSGPPREKLRAIPFTQHVKAADNVRKPPPTINSVMETCSHVNIGK